MNEENASYLNDGAEVGTGRTRLLISLVQVFAGLVLLAALVWPVCALVVSTVSASPSISDAGKPPVASGVGGDVGPIPLFDTRLYLLLGKTLGLVLPATLLSTVLGGLGAVCLVRSPLRGRALLFGGMLAVLLCSPMVYAFSWNGVLSRVVPRSVPAQKIILSDNAPPPAAPLVQPSTFGPSMRCVLYWSLWAWPVSAIALAWGWIGRGRACVEAASLDTTYVQAFIRVLLRAMLPWLLVPAMVTAILLLNDYAVPHACGLIVYGTELLAWSSRSADPLDALLPAVPQFGLLILLSIPAWWAGKVMLSAELARHGRSGVASAWWLAAGVLLLSAVWLVPVGLLVARLGSLDALSEAWRVYGYDVGVTLAWAAGVASVLAGVGLGARRIGVAVLSLWLLFGLLPGSLVGVSMIAAYNRPWMFWIYDGPFIVFLAYVARYGWIGFISGMVMHADRSKRVADQAAVDGADGWQTAWWIQRPQFAPFLLGASFIVAALSVGDVTASSLVRSPAFSPVPHIMIEKFHRFEDAMLVSLALFVAASAIPAALSFWFYLRVSGSMYGGSHDAHR